MTKKNADYVHFANWLIPKNWQEPVVVLVTWWEPEIGSTTFFYEDADEALKTLSSPEWNQQFMTELDDAWHEHDDVVVRVMAF